MEFIEKMHQAMEQTILANIKKGTWLWVEHVKLPKVMLTELLGQIDMDRVRGLLKHKLENLVADKIMNAMTTEITNDVKHVLSDGALRAEIRDLVRAKLEEFVADKAKEA